MADTNTVKVNGLIRDVEVSARTLTAAGYSTAAQNALLLRIEDLVKYDGHSRSVAQVIALGEWHVLCNIMTQPSDDPEARNYVDAVQAEVDAMRDQEPIEDWEMALLAPFPDDVKPLPGSVRRASVTRCINPAHYHDGPVWIVRSRKSTLVVHSWNEAMLVALSITGA